STFSVQPRLHAAGTPAILCTVPPAAACSSPAPHVALPILTCVAVSLLPQASVYVQVRVMVPPQAPPTSGPSVEPTTPLPSQLSVQPRSNGAGTSSIHCTDTSAGSSSSTGSVVSSIVMIWVAV